MAKSAATTNHLFRLQRAAEEAVEGDSAGVQCPNPEAAYEEISIVSVGEGVALHQSTLRQAIALAAEGALDMFRDGGVEKISSSPSASEEALAELHGAWSVTLEPGTGTEFTEDTADFRTGRFVVDVLNRIQATAENKGVPVVINVIWFEGE